MDFQSVDRYIEHSYILDGNELHFHLKNDGKGEFMGKQGRILVVWVVNIRDMYQIVNREINGLPFLYFC